MQQDEEGKSYREDSVMAGLGNPTLRDRADLEEDSDERANPK